MCTYLIQLHQQLRLCLQRYPQHSSCQHRQQQLIIHQVKLEQTIPLAVLREVTTHLVLIQSMAITGTGSASDQSTSIESNSATTDLTQDNTHAKDKKNQDKKDTTSSSKDTSASPP